MHHVAELDVGDVDHDLVGHVLRQALDLHLAQVVLDHAAFLHADGLTGLVHRHAHGDRLRAAHRQEVDVHEPRVDVVALDLAGDRQVLLAVDHEVDEHVRAGAAVQQVAQLARVDRERRGVEALSVEHGGDLPGGAELAGDALAGVGTSFGVELGFHGEDGALRGRGRRNGWVGDTWPMLPDTQVRGIVAKFRCPAAIPSDGVVRRDR